MSSKVSTLCMVALFLFYTLTYATARPAPIFSDLTPTKTQQHGIPVHIYASSLQSWSYHIISYLPNNQLLIPMNILVLLNIFDIFFLKVAEAEKVMVEESCEGVGEDECLQRRTLAAHTDYIYTQKHKPWNLSFLGYYNINYAPVISFVSNI